MTKTRPELDSYRTKKTPVVTAPPKPSTLPTKADNLKLEPIVNIPPVTSEPTSTTGEYAPGVPAEVVQPEEIIDLTPANPQNIGVLLPLTGKSEAIGRKTIRSLELGLGITDSTTSPFKIIAIDSQAFAGKLEQAVDQLVQSKRCIAIVGSISGRDSEIIAERAQKLSVPLLNLSQKQNLTKAGPYIFQTAITYSQQTRFLARTAIRDLGLKRFAVMYPNDSFGTELVNVFWDEVLANGGFITAAQTYDPAEKDFSGYVKRMTGMSYPELRKEEFNKLRKEKKKVEKSQREADRDDILTPSIAFDAIFVPDQLKVGSQVSAFLAYHGIKTPKILGLSLWSSSVAPRRFSQVADQVLIVDTSKNINTTRFSAQFSEMTADEIGPFDVQAFETGALLKSAFSQNPSTRSSLRQILSETNQLNLDSGLVGFSTDRELVRDYSLYFLKDGGLVPLPIQTQ